MAVLILKDARIDGQRTRRLRPEASTVVRNRQGWLSANTVTSMIGADEQIQILALLRAGRSDARIAKRLGITLDEVRAAIDAVIAAAPLDDEARLAELARQVGITPPRD